MKITPNQLRRLITLIAGALERDDTVYTRRNLIEDTFIQYPERAKRILESVDLQEENPRQFVRELIKSVLNEETPEDDVNSLFLLMEVVRDDLRGDRLRDLNALKEEIQNPPSKRGIRRFDVVAILSLVFAVLTFLFGDGIYNNIQNALSNSNNTPVVEDIPTDEDDNETEVVQAPSDTPEPFSTTNNSNLTSGDLTLTAIYQRVSGTDADTDTPPSATTRPSNTPVPPSNTPIPTNTVVPSNTPVPPSNTPIPTNTPVPASPSQDEPLVSLNAMREFDGVEMLRVPDGCFEMGSNSTDAEPDETPATTVCLDAFWIDRYEVSNAQFAQFGSEAINSSTRQETNYPRDNVSWFEANAHCEARDARLPTEAEWEYAASGVDNLAYPWGNEFITNNFIYSANSLNTTAPIGSLGVTSWIGAYDMAGNVLEWTSTIYGIETTGTSDTELNFTDAGETLYSYPYTPDDGRNATPVVNNQQQPYVVVRGSSYRQTGDRARTASRHAVRPQDASNAQGIRCVIDA